MSRDTEILQAALDTLDNGQRWAKHATWPPFEPSGSRCITAALADAGAYENPCGFPSYWLLCSLPEGWEGTLGEFNDSHDIQWQDVQSVFQRALALAVTAEKYDMSHQS